MKITINDVKKFNKETSAVLSIVARKAVMPVLGHVRLTDKVIQSTDLDTVITANIADLITVERAGGVLIPARALFTAIKNKKTGSLNIETLPDNQVLVGNLKTQGLSDKEFPVFPCIAGAEKIADIPGLPALLKKISHVSGEEDTRYTITGICFDFRKNRIIATDGHQLMTIYAYSRRSNIRAIIPKGTVKALEKIKTGYEIYRDKTDHMYFKNCRYVVTSRIIKGSYPDYKRVIPDRNPGLNLATVNRKQLIEKIDIARVTAPDHSDGISLYYRKGELVVFAVNPDTGETRESTSCEFRGDIAAGFGIKAGYILNILKSFDSETVSLQFGNSIGPIRIFGKSDGHITAVVMPMHLGKARNHNHSYADQDYAAYPFQEFPESILRTMKTVIVANRIKRQLQKARTRAI